ncbi:hypothetical protein ACLB2K_064572 [Fragaria x ananassa]
MAVSNLQKQYIDYKASLFHEGVLDEQFEQLQQLQDESNPQFVVEVVSIFFKDSARILNDLTKTLTQQDVDFKKVGANVHQLKGSSSSIGAQRVQRVCIAFRNFGEEHNIEGCLKTLQLVKHECAIVQNKLESLFKLEQQIMAAGSSVPR